MPSTPAEIPQITETSAEKILPVDTLAEVGRKMLLAHTAQIRQFAFTDTQSDTAPARQRVRQMQHALTLLKPHYKPKTLRSCKRALSRLSGVLGSIRHLDGLIQDLHTFGDRLDEEQRTLLQAIIDKLIACQTAARQELMTIADSAKQRRLFDSLPEMAGNPVAANSHSRKIQPLQIRHLLPGLIYERLAVIRAYDEALAEADTALLERLRMEFKRLLSLVQLCREIPGKQISEFIDEVQEVQATLERLHDTAVARKRLSRHVKIGKKKYAGIVEGYNKYCDDRGQVLMAEFKEQWLRFNSRKIQQKLSTALLALYDN